MTDYWCACWHCGLPLLDDETDLCAPCSRILVPLDNITVLAFERLGAFDIKLAREMTDAAVEQHVGWVEEVAADWADEHELDDDEAARYRARARQRCALRLGERATCELEIIGVLNGRRIAEQTPR